MSLRRTQIMNHPALHDESGFTLVELAICAVIIGLLVGGVLKGREVIENARVTSAVMEMKAIDAATGSFKKIYGALPGDIRDPGARLPNCTSTICNPSGAFLQGNGDGLIGNVTTGFNNGLGWSERLPFWLHLNRADLFTKLDVTGVENIASQRSQDRLPRAPFEYTGYQIVQLNLPRNAAVSGAPVNTYRDGARGRFILIKGLSPSHSNPNVSLSYEATANTGLAITPKHAMMIDTKMDDGIPGTGRVIAISGTNANCMSDDRTYNVANNPTSDPIFQFKICNIMVRMDN